MPNRCACSLLAVLVAGAVVVSRPHKVEAQAATPSLPGAPQPTPSYPGGPHPPFGAQGGSGSYSISAAANLGRRQYPARRDAVRKSRHAGFHLHQEAVTLNPVGREARGKEFGR